MKVIKGDTGRSQQVDHISEIFSPGFVDLILYSLMRCKMWALLASSVILISRRRSLKTEVHRVELSQRR